MYYDRTNGIAAVPKPNEKPKALTNDQKQQNLVFTRECKKLWKEALNELRERVVEGVKKMEMKKNRNSSDESSMKEVESERKSKSDGDRSRERGSKERDDSDAVSISSSIKGNNNKTSKYELSVLNDLSLKTFLKSNPGLLANFMNVSLTCECDAE